MGTKQVNTTAYHLQTDGLVERFNRTVINMLAKRVEKSGQDCDEYLLYMLFAYRSTAQNLFYGHDPRLPTELCMNVVMDRSQIDLNSHECEVISQMVEAWELARRHVKKAKQKQKNKCSQPVEYSVGHRVFILMPSARNYKAYMYKFARPFHGPYQVVVVHDAGVEVHPVDRPQAPLICMPYDRVHSCPLEIDVF